MMSSETSQTHAKCVLCVSMRVEYTSCSWCERVPELWPKYTKRSDLRQLLCLRDSLLSLCSLPSLICQQVWKMARHGAHQSGTSHWDHRLGPVTHW